MTALAWPANLIPTSVSFRLDPRTSSGGATLSGDEQTVSRDSGRWLATLSSIPIQSAAQIFAFRALIDGLDGRAGTVLVPAFEDLRSPRLQVAPPLLGSVIINPAFEQRWPRLSATPYEFTTLPIAGVATIASAASINFAASSDALPKVGQFVTLAAARRYITAVDGAVLSFAPALNLGAVTFTPTSAILGSAAASRAASVDIAMLSGNAPQPGMRFGIANNLHSIISATPSGGVTSCRIRPVLRAGFGAGTALKFEGAVCEMRLASDDAGQLVLEALRFGSPSIDLVEA